MLTNKQIEQRKSYITGSDAAVILGFSKWKTPFDLWREKSGLSEHKDLSTRADIAAGNILEKTVREWFEQETSKKVSCPEGLQIHPKHDWMAGHIDGWIEDENAVLEIKTSALTDAWGDAPNGDIPPHYLIQLAHYCEVMQASKGYLAVMFLLFRGIEFRIYEYNINNILQSKMVEREKEFFNIHIKNNVAPIPTTTSDVSVLYPKSNESTVCVDEVSMMTTIERLQSLKNQEKELKKEIDELQMSIMLAMKDSDLLVNSDGTKLASYRSTKKFNEDKFKAENNDIYAEFSHEVLDLTKLRKEKASLYNKYMIEGEGPRRFLLSKISQGGK
jgi:putative phage-type endonuclease